MRTFKELWRSTIFSKWVMAISGLCWVGFLFGHLAGNLLIFLGPEDTNAYAVGLREMLHGSAIWVARGGLVITFALHVWSGIRLSRLNAAARPEKYSRVESRRSTVASRGMLLSGLVLLTYIGYHLAHFTWGVAHPQYAQYTYDLAGHGPVHDVYRMVVESFADPLIAALYVLAMIFVSMHLNHAISSAFQTLGVNHPRYTPIIRLIGPGLALAVALGFIAIPLSVQLGLVH